VRTIGEVSRISGVSVRALRLYDTQGLLKPCAVTEAGYRLYDDDALARLHLILLFRALRFPLKDIRDMLDAPGFQPEEALTQQLALLEMQRDQLDRLIGHTKQLIQTGVKTMDFSVFDETRQQAYADEVKSRWGATDAYREYENRTKQRPAQEQSLAADGLMRVLAAFGEIRTLDPAAPEAQQLVQQLQAFITAHYYECTMPILMGLGQMYTADERFRKNIDAAGGEGTAEFVSHAIESYCK